MLELNKIYQGDCLEIMKDIDDKSIDLVLTDPPYGTTTCKWDSVIPFDKMWEQLKRIAKEHCPILLFGSEPFTSALIMSNVNQFRHQWIWDKCQAGNPLLAPIMPLKVFEDIVVFSQKSCNYYPIIRYGLMRKKGGRVGKCERTNHNHGGYSTRNNIYYPTSIIKFSNANQRGKYLHPTQKPLSLIKYLIRTYSNENDIVLDFAAGSGTTGVACKKLNRKFIMIEKEEKYCKIAQKRLDEIGKSIFD